VSTQEAYDAELAQLREEFAANIKRLRSRRESDNSQEDLATAARLHRTEIGAIEQSKRNPSLHTLLILADALDVTLNDLAEGLPVPKERQPRARARRGPPNKI
jgi:transcriptional regulator with XRE-family HTH domain